MSFIDKMANAFQDELQKIEAEKCAAAAPASNMLVPGLVAGALGTMMVQRAHRDWRMGRAMRMQNQVQGY